MTPPAACTPRPSRRAALLAIVLTGLIGLSWAAQTVAAEQGVQWRELKPAQQAALKPLEREWSGISVAQKRKWIELSGGFASRSPADQARIQERMAEWARLSTQQRSQARLHFQEAKQLPPQDRKARWEAYQALPPEKRQQLAARAAPSASASTARPTPSRDTSQAKSNIVPNPNDAAPPKVVSPTLVQARPGATTNPINKRPSPPSHQQTGLPKIAATPEFVNKATLLPQRGPQGAATRSAAAPASEPPHRQ